MYVYIHVIHKTRVCSFSTVMASDLAQKNYFIEEKPTMKQVFKN